MHILHLTPHFYWPQLSTQGWPVKFDTMGGMQNQLYRQVNMLSEMKVNQTLVTLKIPMVPREWIINSQLKIVSVRIPILPIRSRIRGMVDLNISWFLGALFYIINNRNHFSIAHVHCSGVGLPLLLGIIISKLLRKRLVLTIHCSAIATYKPMNLLDKYLLHPLSKFLEFFALKTANKCIFLTERTRDICSSFSPAIKKKSIIVPDSIDPNAFRNLATNESVADFKKKYNLPKDKYIILYIGRIAREKGWNEIIKIAHLNKDKGVHFLIVGDGNEFDLMVNEIKKRGLCDCFTFTGYISQEMVPTAFKCGDIKILPSQHEEFGSVILEAMSMGVPTIAYAVGGVKNVITHAKTGILVPPGEAATMAAEIRGLLKDKKLYNDISQASISHVANNYSLNEICKGIMSIYKEINSEGGLTQ